MKLIYLTLTMMMGVSAYAGQISCRYSVDVYQSCNAGVTDCHNGLIRNNLETDEFTKKIADGKVDDFRFVGKTRETDRFVFDGFASSERLVDMQIRDTQSQRRVSAAFEPQQKATSFELIMSEDNAGAYDVHLFCVVLDDKAVEAKAGSKTKSTVDPVTE